MVVCGGTSRCRKHGDLGRGKSEVRGGRLCRAARREVRQSANTSAFYELLENNFTEKLTTLSD